jgi:hypothetical protein
MLPLPPINSALSFFTWFSRFVLCLAHKSGLFFQLLILEQLVILSYTVSPLLLNYSLLQNFSLHLCVSSHFTRMCLSLPSSLHAGHFPLSWSTCSPQFPNSWSKLTTPHCSLITQQSRLHTILLPNYSYPSIKLMITFLSFSPHLRAFAYHCNQFFILHITSVSLPSV